MRMNSNRQHIAAIALFNINAVLYQFCFVRNSIERKAKYYLNNLFEKTGTPSYSLVTPFYSWIRMSIIIFTKCLFTCIVFFLFLPNMCHFCQILIHATICMWKLHICKVEVVKVGAVFGGEQFFFLFQQVVPCYCYWAVVKVLIDTGPLNTWKVLYIFISIIIVVA
ncbi:hypothetical protein Tsp_06761 [Trichinella spiralis]|uniref:hypothetical protein n=1 Tax=Trichinella spiralis TaxID=6334 RepID=UPI0001EFC3ED|nr:hypothetical protein Tsp_06761 [Trichinella spiralis]